MILTQNKEVILKKFNDNFPNDMKVSFENNKLTISENHKIYTDLRDFSNDKVSSLPFFTSSQISWITIAPTLENLRSMIEDLRNWIIPSFAWEEAYPIITSENVDGEFAKIIIKISPYGYFKWSCHTKDFDMVINKLNKMRFISNETPEKNNYIYNNISFYREQFAIAISTGDQETAFSSIREINKKQLDLAKNTLFMEIRAHEIFQNYKDIVNHPQLDELLSISLPLKITISILKSFYEIYLYELEIENNFTLALKTFEKKQLHNQLATLFSENIIRNNLIFARMSCYEMILNKRFENLTLIKELYPNDVVLDYFSKDFEKIISNSDNSQRFEKVNNPNTDDLGWDNLINYFKSKDLIKIKKFYSNFSRNYDSEKFKIGNGIILLELFTDNQIAEDYELKEELDNILYSIIDFYICDPSFPKNDNEELYKNILEIWMLKHLGSTQYNHTQLFIIIVETLLTINLNRKLDVVEKIKSWWKERPVKAGLDCLGTSIEIYLDQTGDNSIISLWYEGFNFIKNDLESFNKKELSFWLRLGKRLGVDKSFLESNIHTEIEENINEDILKLYNFKKIAIVSLQENSAKIAASEIKERTNADILLINKNAANEFTESAKTADVVLYVWASAKHSIYRAFDNNRDILQYVKGTGSTSIVRALENWVTNKIYNQE